MSSYHEEYRPQTFAEVVGQKDAVAALRNVIKTKTSHAFLFSSTTPGIGKTTLARIAAKEVGCLPTDIMEVSAAVLTGVDDMRRVQDAMEYRSFHGKGERAVILDECARLSKNAWDSLLKIIEEAPEHAYFFFCTTDVGKVPSTIKTRCVHINLNPLTDDQIVNLLHVIMARAKLKVSDEVVDVIVRSAQGSARQALVNLALCQNVADAKIAAQLTQNVLDSDPVLELCRFLLKGGSWGKAMGLVAKLEQEPPEGVRIVVCRYLAKTLIGTRDDKEALFLLRTLEAFEKPFNPSEGQAPLLLAIGATLFSKE
jgi:DNA polymerase III gamma/tau subunit